MGKPRRIYYRTSTGLASGKVVGSSVERVQTSSCRYATKTVYTLDNGDMVTRNTFGESRNCYHLLPSSERYVRVVDVDSILMLADW